MGRPLKIAKAQVLTLTATNGSTEVVTVSENLNNLNVIANMPFVVATTTGGLTAGTTYWILKVLTANTFTVSATPISANPDLTPVNLSSAGPVTVKISVGSVDTGFQNPDSAAQSGGTSTNPGASYGVVGGNTTIYGKQVLVAAAIGISGTGTIVSSSSSADVFGGGTDFANTVVAGSAIQSVAANGATTNLGFVTSIGGYVTEVVTDTELTGSFVITSGDATNFTVDKPIVFDDDIGGLTAGTVYYVQDIANTTHFNVSLNPGGAPVLVTDDTVTVNATQDVMTLVASAAASNPAGVSWIYANDEAGFIVRQKGKQKYLVTGATSGLTAQCLTANVANTALTPNTMSILATYANSSTVLVQSLSDYNTELFTATSGPVASGNIVLANANPAYATFNTAYAANTYGGQPYPIVTINNA
jgi:hypothetical protein